MESISSSSGRSSSSYRSSTLAEPDTSQLPSDCFRKSSVTSSCSSQISPTSSSRISSSVMIPSVPPYSSTTTARWWCCSRRVRSSWEICVEPVVYRVGTTRSSILVAFFRRAM